MKMEKEKILRCSSCDKIVGKMKIVAVELGTKITTTCTCPNCSKK